MVSPAEVGPQGVGDRRVVDLFEVLLAHVGYGHPCRFTGPLDEGPPERVPQADREDLVPAGPSDEGIVRGDRVGLPVCPTRIDADHLAKQRLQVLGVVLGIVSAATIPGAEEEVVAEEMHLAAVVIVVVGVGDPDDLSAVGGGDQGALAAALLDDDVSVRGRVVDVEPAGFPVVTGEGDREQAHFTAGLDTRADVEEGFGHLPASTDHHYAPGLLDDEHQIGEPRGRLDLYRLVEVGQLHQKCRGVRSSGGLTAGRSGIGTGLGPGTGRQGERSEAGQHQAGCQVTTEGTGPVVNRNLPLPVQVESAVQV